MYRELLAAVLAAGLAVFGLPGCDFGTLSSSDREPGSGGGNGADDGDDSPSTAVCSVDSGCTLVASSCCGCPTFAAPADFADSCDEVECPQAPECAPAAAICDVGQCELVCDQVVATQLCDGSFVVDDAGCTLDLCEPDADPECGTDTECLIVPADCCGCDLGGNDTAVPATSRDEHLASLMCDGPISCPGVSTCEQESRAACLGGRCRYLTGPDGSTGANVCGTLDSGPCPAGEVCVLNANLSDTAPIPGIGVCQPE